MVYRDIMPSPDLPPQRDLRSLYHAAASQRAMGRTTAVLRGLVTSGRPFIYVVHNDVMVRHVQRIIADLRRIDGQVLAAEPIRVFSQYGQRFLGTQHPIIFDHVCIEFLLREAAGITTNTVSPNQVPPDQVSLPGLPWWKRLHQRAVWCIKRA